MDSNIAAWLGRSFFYSAGVKWNGPPYCLCLLTRRCLWWQVCPTKDHRTVSVPRGQSVLKKRKGWTTHGQFFSLKSTARPLMCPRSGTEAEAEVGASGRSSLQGFTEGRDACIRQSEQGYRGQKMIFCTGIMWGTLYYLFRGPRYWIVDKLIKTQREGKDCKNKI